MPNRQADITPPGDPDPPGEHVGEHVEAPTKVQSGLVDAKLNTKVSLDVGTWAEMTDLSDGGEKTFVRRIIARAGATASEADYGRRAEDADAEARATSIPKRGNRRNSRETRHIEDSREEPAAAPEAVNFSTNLKYEAAAAEPPYTPYPAPNRLQEPWAPYSADNSDKGR